MTTYEYQIALDPNDAHFDGGVQHIVAVGDAIPLCGKDEDDFVLTEWSEVLTAHAAGGILIAPKHPTCGKCADDFWSNCA